MAINPETGMLDLTLPQNAASARLQGQADAYFAANPNLDSLTGQPKTNINSTPTPGSGGNTNSTQPPKSAFAIALDLLSKYGISSLSTEVQSLLQDNIGLNEFSVRLKETEPYKKRFAANASRIASGLRALSEAEYISLEDTYAKVFRNYGLPPSYYTKGTDGISKNFESLIAGDVDSTEIVDRIVLAQKRVNDAPPEVKKALKDFYPDINSADILAYTLDPTKGMEDIKRKVTAAEIGGSAMSQGLKTDVSRAEELARFGVTGEGARRGYKTVAEVAPRGSQLAAIYGQDAYGQAEAEQEVFGLSGSAATGQRRKKLSELERSAFGGQTGATTGALSRDRAGSF